MAQKKKLPKALTVGGGESQGGMSMLTDSKFVFCTLPYSEVKAM